MALIQISGIELELFMYVLTTREKYYSTRLLVDHG